MKKPTPDWFTTKDKKVIQSMIDWAENEIDEWQEFVALLEDKLDK